MQNLIHKSYDFLFPKQDLLYNSKLITLANSTLIGIITSVLLSIPLVFLLHDVSSSYLLFSWFSAVIIVNAIRLINIIYYKKSGPKVVNSISWQTIFYLGFIFSGILWGSTVIFLAPVENQIYSISTALWLGGIASGASASYAILKRVFFTFSIFALGPTIIYFYSTGDNIYTNVATGITAYFLFLSLNTFSLNKLLSSTLKREIEERNHNKILTRHKNILSIIADASEKLLEDSSEETISELLNKLGTTLDVSHVHIFENLKDENLENITTHLRYFWTAENAPAHKYDAISISYKRLGLERWENELSNGKPIVGNLNNFPKNEKEFLQSINIQSLFALPIFVGNEWWGFICFDECRHKRDWKTEEVDALKTVAAVIGAAIKRTWAENKLSYHASHDSLTGLANRRAFEIHLDNIVSSCKKTRQAHMLCYIDLDRFKVINDTCGHNAGDNLLRQLGNLMKQTVRKNDMVARLGGDEFAILLESVSMDEAKIIADGLRRSIETFSFKWNENIFRVGASFGLVAIDSHSRNADKILQTADNACRAVKMSNSNQIRIYNVDDTAISDRRLESQSYIRINQALENDEFDILFQPITKVRDVSPGNWDHYEVLIRMLNENNSLISPNNFLPTAERYNLITKIDRWVFKACIKKLSQVEELYANVNTLSINISGASLCDPSFLKYVISLFDKNKTPAAKICFEITETVAVSNLVEANNFITQLRELGCRFALDDFGTGFSSFENLKHLPVDYVKIDGIFIREIDTNPVDYEMVSSLHKVSKLMGIQTVAEYVESKAILNTLSAIGVDYVQGYAIHKPMTLDEVLNSDAKPEDSQLLAAL